MPAIGQSGEAVKLALDTLRKNKLRSGLTILGISIGIATVILISSAINGLNSNIDHFVSTLGTNDLWIFQFEPFGHRPTTEELNRKKLTYEDGVAMRSLPHVIAVDPELTYQNFQTGLGSVAMKAGTHKIQNTIINGSTEAVTQVVDVNLKEGRMWTESEAEHSDNVVVLGHDAAEDLFPDKSPLGQDVDCEGDIFTVIGVLDPQPQPGQELIRRVGQPQVQRRNGARAGRFRDCCGAAGGKLDDPMVMCCAGCWRFGVDGSCGAQGGDHIKRGVGGRERPHAFGVRKLAIVDVVVLQI